MKELKRWWRSFHKNVIVKRKFKAYWCFYFDPEYRAQVKHIFEITKNSTGIKNMPVPTHLLVHGHKLIYHAYAESLMLDDTTNLEPIKVIYHNDRYVVIDGNHRLPAIKARAQRLGTTMTSCEVILVD